MHKTNSFIKILAILLTLTVTLTAIPNAVYAAVNIASQDTGRQQDTVDISTPIAPDNPDIPLDTEITRANAEIFCELTENRTEFTKDYLLTNGQQVSVIYPEAVHYQENGKWEEIDNTLLAKRDGSGTISTASGPFTVTFPEKIGQGAITVTQGKYSISFSLDTQTRKVVESSTLGKESTSEVVESISKVSATIRQNTRVEQEGIKEQTFPSKIYSGLTYANVFSSVDLRYDVRPYMLKETIVIKSFDTTQSGYSFTLDAGELIPVLLEDGSITLQDKQTQEKVFEIESPYLMDANEKISRDIVVTLQKAGTGRDNIWNITYTLPLDWMRTAAYPVALDPVIQTDGTNNLAIEDIAVAETNSDLDTFGYDVMYLRAGKSTYYGRLRSFVKFTELKPLTPGDVITHAEIGLYKATTDTDYMTICVSDVTSSWKSHTNGVSLTWANQPSIASTYEDYLLIKNAGYYYWDITDLVRGWYETGVNNGVAITAYNESSCTDYKRFYSSDNVGDNPLPVLYVYYTNATGLEDYWDYASVSAGVAGEGYVNLFSGNLTWIHPDLAYGGNHPVSISHVYNSGSVKPDSEYDSKKDPYGTGNGWKTNYNQRVYELEDENLDDVYYVWEDGDGTKHYFKYGANGEYVDDANTGLSIPIFIENQGEISSAEIVDKQGNKLLFGPGGRLKTIIKNNEELSSINITYKPGTGDNRYKIDTITDESGRVYTYEYNASTGLLSGITVKDSGGTIFDSIVFTYMSDGTLSGVQYGDGTPYTSFGYKTNNLLSFITERDTDYAISITYSAGTTPKVTKILEEINYGVSTKSGSQLTFSYVHNQTTMQDRSGHIQILQFNDYGNTICVQDDKGNASFGEYTFNDYDEDTSVSGKDRKNQLTLSSNLQSTVGNKLSDPTLKNWSTYWGEMAQYTAGTVTSSTEAHTGSESIKMTMSSAANNPSIVYNHKDYIYINPGESFTFSAYVKISGVIDGDFYLSLSTSVSGQNHSNYVTTTNGEWKRLEVTYTHLGTTQARIYPYLILDGEGSVYVDSLQIEKGKSASRFNIVQNSDLASSSTTTGILGWTVSSTSNVTRVNISSAITNGKPATDTLDNNVIKMVGNPNNSVYAYQQINISGSKDDSFVVSGWAKGDSVQLGEVQSYAPERTFGIKVQFLNGSTVVNETILSFNPDMDSINRWQYLAGQAVAEANFTSIKIYLLYEYNLNTAYFDGIQLYKEKFGTEYEYNNDANISDVTDVQGGTTEYSYNETDESKKNDVESVTLADNTTYGFEYDEYHNVIKETTPKGTVYSYVYDQYGNNTKAYIGTISNPKQIGVIAEYDANGEYMTSITDTAGNKTRYGYDSATGRLLWVQYPNDTASTRTEYTYDSRGRLLSISKYNGANTVTENNTYTDGLLSALGHTGQTESEETGYAFLYNNFDLLGSVKVGTRTLASYAYNNAYEKQLTSLTYGNGHSVSYAYDDQGRTTSITYNSNTSPSLTYTYDQEGRLVEVGDTDAGTTAKYKYDKTDKLIEYEVRDTNQNIIYAAEYTYSLINDVIIQIEAVNNKILRTNYTYNTDNMLTGVITSFDLNIITQQQAYSYDSLGRLVGVNTKEGSNNIVSTSLTYKAPNNTHASNMLVSTTTILSQWANTYGGTTSRYYYEYDGNGNITEISPDSAFNDGDGVEFQYDSINQLTRVNDSITGETWTYTYDLGGNILSKSKYAYTRGSLGTVLSTVTYGYGDSSWADLLTSYKGKTITYDAIGNPLDDGTWEYTWEKGRQLASMEGVSSGWEFTYDANGQRLTKSNGTLTYHYIYNDMQLMYMKVTQNTSTVCEMYFQYGQLGLMAIQYISSSLTDTYYVVTNAQGDVVALVDGNGTVVVNYTYDAWGKLQAMTGSKASTVGKYNPIRYRGYVYDTETQLYYLNTRYYNPDMGRFINADSYADTGDELLGSNMFAYCGNNPVIYYDPTGTLLYPGEIHNEVVRRIANKNEYNKEQFILYQSGGFGRADLISSEGQVWDVKRDKPKQIEAGKKQVAKYVENIWARYPDTSLSVGGNEIESGSFYYKSGLITYTVTYRYAGDGVIAYDYRVSDFDYQTLAITVLITGFVATAGTFVGLLSGAFLPFLPV